MYDIIIIGGRGVGLRGSPGTFPLPGRDSGGR